MWLVRGNQRKTERTKMKYQRRHIKEIAESLKYLASLEVSPKLSVKILKNMKLVQDEFEIIKVAESQIQKNKKWFEYEKQRMQIFLEYGAKNEDGSLRLHGMDVVFETEAKLIQAQIEIDGLNRKHPEEVELKAAFDRSMNELLSEEVEFLPMDISSIQSLVVTEKIQAIMDLFE